MSSGRVGVDARRLVVGVVVNVEFSFVIFEGTFVNSGRDFGNTMSFAAFDEDAVLVKFVEFVVNVEFAFVNFVLSIVEDAVLATFGVTDSAQISGAFVIGVVNRPVMFVLSSRDFAVGAENAR